MTRIDRQMLRWALIGMVAVGLRAYRLDARSLWFDEVVTMRLAREPSPAAMVSLLDRIDGSRAPLHPFLLYAWLAIFGESSLAARALSAATGVATVALVLMLGRRARDDRTGELAAWGCALCPPLVYYSQEVRMYSLLAFLTAASWLALAEVRRRPSLPMWAVYACSLAGLFYAHPLSVFMIAAHLAVGLAGVATGRLPAGRWATAIALAGLAAAPWLPRYAGQGTDYPIPLYPIRFLLATPIEFIGGNGLTLLLWGSAIVFGLVDVREGRPRLRSPEFSLAAACWFAAPPTLMYAYSWLLKPIFGQSRYQLFTAPAYFLLIAAGLAVMPRLLRWTGMLALTALASFTLATSTYAPNHKADWRSAAAWLRAEDAGMVVVHAGDPRFLREPLEAASYYLEPGVAVEPAGWSGGSRPQGAVVYHAHGFAPAEWTPPEGERVVARFHGLTITRGEAAGASPP